MAGSIVQEVRVTNDGTALSNFQVSLSNPVMDETGLLACWHFDESSGQDALDTSEYKLHLTFTGTTTASGIQTNLLQLCLVQKTIFQMHDQLMSLNIDHLDKVSTMGMRFAVPVGGSVKTGVLLWPRSLEHEALGIDTIPFTKRGDRD